MSDIIASARSMTTVADGQYVAIGMPKAALTPATLTAMVGMSRGWGNGLSVSSSVTNAIANLRAVDPLDPNYTNAQDAADELEAQRNKL